MEGDGPVFNVGRNAYNAFVQEVQREAMAFGMEHRVRPTYFDGGRIDGTFEVFWECWHTLGTETRAMTPQAEHTIYPALWPRIVAEAAASLVKP